MKICNIMPLSYSYLMYSGDMVMLLAHLASSHEDYKKEARSSSLYKIIDNSIIELGEAFALSDLIKEARNVKANEIILPDAFQDGKETLKLVKKSIAYLKEHKMLGEFKIQAVAHGKTVDKFIDSFIELNNMKEVDVIGIPKVLTKDLGSRVEAMKEVLKRGIKINKEIHFLGCWESFNELKEMDKNMFNLIRSMDSCLLALLSMRYKKGDSLFDIKRPTKTLNLVRDKINVNNFYALKSELDNYIKEHF